MNVESIGIIVSKESNTKTAIRVIRQFVSEPISNLLKKISAGEEVVKMEIVGNEYYLGIRDFMTMLSALEQAQIQYHLTRNGEREERSFFERINRNVENMNLEDIR